MFHVASPFVMKVEDVDRDLLQPAVGGTENILNAVAKADSVTTPHTRD